MNKAGRNPSGSQKYQCKICRRITTAERKLIGHDEQTRQMALRMVAEGMSRRKIGRVMGISAQSVSNWLAEYVKTLPEPAKPTTTEVTELDELYTFVGDKKTDCI